MIVESALSLPVDVFGVRVKAGSINSHGCCLLGFYQFTHLEQVPICEIF